jgi:16S rRNA (cytosine967-C5)-methyltransferase
VSADRKSSRRLRADPARTVALDALRAVRERDAYVNLTLPRLLRERRIGGRDAAFATELANGSLRWRRTYDHVLAACVDRPLDQLDPGVLDVLRLGCHQLLALRTPAHAGVAATVDLAKDAAGPGPATLVNAVLRRVAGRSLPEWVAEVTPPQATPLQRLGIGYSHPDWMVEAIHAATGSDLEATAAALAADNLPPLVSLAARPGRSTVEELLTAGAEAGRWSAYAATLPAGDPGGIAAVREQRAGVQDEGSQLVALALAAAPVRGRDTIWLDLCAGPGGKAALLSGLAGQRRARLLAADRLLHRARLVHGALAGAGGVLGVVAADGTRGAWTDASFDRVLVDAPCTGLGALRRRPEARWRRTPADLDALLPLQRQLLSAAVDAVRPGGVVVYATCSPHPAETRDAVDAVLADRGDVAEEDARALLPQVPELGAGRHVQLWPHLHGTDAMFFALLRRIGRPGSH